MCGICGIFHHGKLEVSPAQICRMRDIMYERGPDAAGYVLLPQIALGHRRLKIIDLSDAANQPMTNEDRSVWVVFNGEIYNFRELRRELLTAGHQFQSTSDTEVLVHGFDEWGTDLFHKIIGMFAIAIYDSSQNRLILARDRVGKKPLYYAEQSGVVYFASDIKAVSYTLPQEPSVDLEALDCYLHHICVPDEHSIFKNIQKVQPGTFQIFTPGRRTSFTYWEWNFNTKDNATEEEFLSQCEKLLQKAVLRRIVSDVPLGVMLSGGVDSSIITAILARNLPGRVKTFTVGAHDYPLGDILAARRVAKQYNTEHHELILDFKVTDILLELIWQYGEPFGDSSAIPTYLVSKTARDYVTVILTGDGGDEAFGGYSNIIVPLNAAIFQHYLPTRFHPPVKRLLEGLGVNPESSSLFGKALFYINYLSGFPYSSFYNLMGFHRYRSLLWTKANLAVLQNHNPLHPYHSIFDKSRHLHPIDQVLLADGRTYLPYDYLVKIDRASMANSVECRSPFLDSDLLDYVGRIPPLVKFTKRRTKYLLKKLGENYLPQEILYTEKRGFGIPVDQWLSNNLRTVCEKIIFNKYALHRDYFNYDLVRQIWAEHQRKINNHKHRLWSLLWFELWHLMFIDKIVDRQTPLTEIPGVLE